MFMGEALDSMLLTLVHYSSTYPDEMVRQDIRNMQNIRIIGFFFENRLHWQSQVVKKFLQTAVLGYIFIYVQKN